MTQEHINIGSAERAGDGESLRSAFAKIESNFTELYARQSTADGNTLSLDLMGNVLGDDSTVMVDASNNTIIATGGITGNVTGQVSDLSNHSLSALSNISDTIPQTGQVLKWNGSEWAPDTDNSGGTGSGSGAITIAGDDSTQRTINGGETLSILGDANISTTTDVEGVLSISLSPVVVADVKGNVLGDDSTIIVDYLNNTITTTVIEATSNAKIATLYTTHIDTLDSSAVNITPNAIFRSDVTVENNLILNNPIDLPAGTTIGGATINTGLGDGGASVTVSDDPPAGADTGDLWWESDSLRLKVRYNNTWIDALPVGGVSVGGSGANVTISDDAPGGTVEAGDLWWESDTGRLKIRYDNYWVDASPQGGAGSAYNATTPTDWNGTAPTTIGDAIDRLAALVKTLNSGTGA